MTSEQKTALLKWCNDWYESSGHWPDEDMQSAFLAGYNVRQKSGEYHKL